MDLEGWLRRLGLEQYEAAFRDNAIDETVLPRLTAEDLKDSASLLLGTAASCSTPLLACALTQARKRHRSMLIRQPTHLLRTLPSAARSR